MPSKITICGLGPGKRKYVTEQTQLLLQEPGEKFLQHSLSSEILPHAETTVLEALSAEQIANFLLKEAQKKEIFYLVSGSPFVLEPSVQILFQQDVIEIVAHPAISFLELVQKHFQIDASKNSTKLVASTNFLSEFSKHSGSFLVTDLRETTLSTIQSATPIPAQHLIYRMHGLGTAQEKISEHVWEELHTLEPPSSVTSLFIPASARPNPSGIQENIALIKTLRNNCPWDMKQTHGSLKKHLEEETAEVLEAIDTLSPESNTGYQDFQEELGDLWLQILLHSEIASEKNHFTIYDVAQSLNEKMIRRHPHVFGESTASTPEELRKQWETIKRQEKEQKYQQEP